MLNEGKRGFSSTKTSARYTQSISGDASGYGYSYVKTVRLVPGKPQMLIEHVLTNTGKKAIDTKVYCHNFLTLGTGNENVAITAPFDIKPGKPFAADAAAVDGKTFRYLRAVKEGESVTSPITGFGPNVSDYDFKVVNTKTGFGQRIRADQPLAQINFWSIRTNVSWEPYIAIALKPGETNAGPIPTTISAPVRAEMRRAALFAALLATGAPAWAQQGTLPASVLDKSRHVPISNGLISAQVFPPGEGALYRGTRFDHAGVVMHITYRGQNYTDYWFDRFVTDPSDTSRRPAGTQTSCCAVSGPVEEFAAVGFEEAGMGGRFLNLALVSSDATATIRCNFPPCPH